MAQDEFADWDVTSSNNTSITGDAAALDIAEGWPAANINNAIRALMSACKLSLGDMPSGTARPTYLTSGKIWKDTTTAASPIYKFYDGTDDITLFTVDTSGNTVTFNGTVSGALANVVEDTTPQSGGNWDLNGFGITFPGATVTDITGADTLLVSGTAGTADNLAKWNADGDLVDGPALSGADATVISGTAGTADNVAIWNSDGDIVDGPPKAVATSATATTSGSSSTIGSIPAGVTQIVVGLSAVSVSGTDELLLQLGDSGGVETTGYVSVASNDTSQQTSTSGFALTVGGAAGDSISGAITLTLVDSSTNTWTCHGALTQDGGSPGCAWNAGTKSLSGALTQLQLDTTGTNTFDAGKWNVRYS